MWGSDIVFHEMPELPDTGVFRDADALAKHLRGISAAGHPHFDVLSLEERGDWVLAALEVSVKGLSSGALTKTSFFQVWRFEGDQVREFRSYLDPEQARGEYDRLSAPKG